MNTDVKDDKKKMKKRFLKAAASKIALRFKKNYEKSKTYLQKTVKRDEKIKDDMINRAHIWELYKNARILFSFPSCNQLQIVEDIAQVLKEGKTPLFQDTVTTNIVACLHDAAQIATTENIPPLDIKVVLRSLDLLFSGIELKPTHMKFMAADTIGLMLALSGNKDLTTSITNKIILTMNNESILARSVNSYIYACIHKYAQERRPKEKDVATILEIVQNCNCEIAQSFVFNALVILTNRIEEEIVVLILSILLSILSRPILPSKKILIIIGQILSSLSATNLKEVNKNRTILSEFPVMLKSCIMILISQKHEEIQAMALKIILQIYNEAPSDVDLKELFPIFIEFLKSEHEGKIVEVAAFVNQLLLYNPQLCCDFINGPWITEKGGFEEFFFEIMQHGSFMSRSAVENFLLNIIINTDLYTVNRKMSIMKFFWSGKRCATPVLQSEMKEEYVSDVENLCGLYINDHKPTIVPNSGTRVFTLKLLQALLRKIAVSMDRCIPTNEVDLSEMIKIAFVASADSNIEIRREGLNLFKEILDVYSSVLDPDFPEQSILEQYQTQIVMALVHSLESNVSVEELNAGCEAIIILLKSGIVTDSSLVKRLCYVLTAELVCIENGTVAKGRSLPFLQTWAEIYCIKYVPKDIYERLQSMHKELLEQLNDSDFDILATLWISAINENWGINSDTNDITYKNLVAKDWSSIFLALSDILTKSHNVVLKFPECSIFKTLINGICYILRNNCNNISEACNKSYLHSLSILLSHTGHFKYNQIDFVDVVEKTLSIILCMDEQKAIKLLPAVLSIITTAEWQTILDFSDFNEKLIAFIRRIIVSGNNKAILDMYNIFSNLSCQTKLNFLLILYLMSDFSNLISVENYDIVLKKEELILIQMTVKFVERLTDNIDLEKKSSIITSLLDSLLRLLIVDVFDFWEQYSVERQNLHIFALEKLRSYAPLYPSELKTILLKNKILATVLKEGLKHQIEYFMKNTNTHNPISQQQPTIQLKTCFRGFEDA